MRRAASGISSGSAVMLAITTLVLGFGLGCLFVGLQPGWRVPGGAKVVTICSIGVGSPSGLRVPAVQTSGGDFATSPGVTGTLVVGQVYEIRYLSQGEFASTIWVAWASTKTPVGHCAS